MLEIPTQPTLSSYCEVQVTYEAKIQFFDFFIESGRTRRALSEYVGLVGQRRP